MEDTPEFPMRINKYLAWKKHSTRRGADLLIEKKQVFINGRLAVLGDKVEEKDVVEVRLVGRPKPYLYFAYNKPVGVVSHSAQFGEKEARMFLPVKGVFPVGRLDKDSHGLMILTNDGRITDKLLNPEYEHEKEYKVTVKERLRNNFQEKMSVGINIEGYTTKPAKTKIIDENTFTITLTEGKKHQIRRMMSALFNEVVDLERIRVMNITLGKLPPGGYRPIEGKELETFLKNLGF